MDIGKLRQLVAKHEGCKLNAYQDSEKVWTIGYGTNLQSLRIDLETAEKWLDEGLKSAVVSARMFPEWHFLDTDARQNAFSEMVYNMGPLRVGGFKNMLAAIRAKDWDTAANEGLASKWAGQVGKRAVTLMRMLRSGQFQE